MPLTLNNAAQSYKFPARWQEKLLADFERAFFYRTRRIPETNVLNRVLVKLHLKRPNTEVVGPDFRRIDGQSYLYERPAALPPFGGDI